MKKKNKKLDDWLDCLNEQNYTNEKEAIVNQNPIKKDLKSEVAKFQYHMYLVAYHHGINNENEKDEKVKLIMNTLGYAVPFRGDCVWFLYSDRAAKDISNALRQIHKYSSFKKFPDYIRNGLIHLWNNDLELNF